MSCAGCVLASLLQSQNNRSWPILLTGADGGSLFEVPFAALATIDSKAQKGSFCLVGGFVAVEDGPESFVIIGAIWTAQTSSFSYWPCCGIIPDVFSLHSY